MRRRRAKPPGRIRVDFGNNYSTFEYDAESKTYLKNYQDSPHMDGVSGEQLAFENVIVLETRYFDPRCGFGTEKCELAGRLVLSGLLHFGGRGTADHLVEGGRIQPAQVFR